MAQIEGQSGNRADVDSKSRLKSVVAQALLTGSQLAPVTPFAQTGNHANSAAPASATLSNTAAGYVTLGGKFQFAAIAGAETDYALFAYQVPVGVQFALRGIAISAFNMGAAVATTATLLEWALGLGASAASLATVDDAGLGTLAPKRIQIGAQSMPVASPIGFAANNLVLSFDPYLIVDAGRFFHVILRMPVGTATGSQIIRGQAQPFGHFE